MPRLFAEPLQQIDRTFVLWHRRKLVYFAGCDYFRLSSHPAILSALDAGLAKFGLNVGASRKTTGNHAIYEELEKRTARFFKAPAALLTSSGYLTNLAVAETLRGHLTAAILDERAHGSLRQAAAMLGCPVHLLKHRDAAALVPLLRKVRNKKRIALLTDGVFAFDGSVAPLALYRDLLGPDALLWVDDSHAAGLLGKHGRGSPEYHQLGRENLVQTITYSKAFGTYGGAILCARALANQMASRSLALSGNTPLPLPLANATLAALELLGPPKFRANLSSNVNHFWKTLALSPGTSRDPKEVNSSGIPIFAFSPAEPQHLKRDLLKRGIFPPLIAYPGAAGSYFRFALSSEHSPGQITSLAETLRPYWHFSATNERHGSS